MKGELDYLLKQSKTFAISVKKSIDPNPPTVKDVLLERWAKDTDAMVEDTKDIHYNVIRERWEFPNGTVALCESDAERLYRAYLNSAAEVGK